MPRVVAFLVLVASCGGSAATTTAPPPSVATSTSSTLAATVATTAAVPEPVVTPVDVPLVDDVAEWRIVLGRDAAAGAPAVFDGSRLLLSQGFDTLLGLDGAAPFMLHPAAPGWIRDDLALGDDIVVIAEHDETEGDYRVLRFVIRDHGGAVLTEWPGAPERHVIPQIAVDANMVAWTETRADGAVCVYVEEAEAACTSSPDQVLQWPHLRDGVLSYQRLGPGECGEVFVQRADAPPERLAVRRCEGFQAVATGDWAVWAEAPAGAADLTRALVYGRGPDGVVYQLGPGSAGSLTSCADRAYWLAETVDHSEIRSWAPGENVRVVYRSPEDSRPTTSPKCGGEWLTIVRSFTGAGESRQSILAAEAP